MTLKADEGVLSKLIDKELFVFYFREILSIIVLSAGTLVMLIAVRALISLSFSIKILGTVPDEQLVLNILGKIHAGWALATLTWLAIRSFSNLVVLSLRKFNK